MLLSAGPALRRTTLLLTNNTVVQAENKLQEHGLQQPAKPRADNGTPKHTQITPPEDFMQTMTPQSLGGKPSASQTVYDVGLPPGEEIDFSDINFAEFSEFDNRYAHAHMNPQIHGDYYPGGLADSLLIATFPSH